MDGSVEFCIIVIAGARYDPDTKILAANSDMATQKLPENAAKKVKGMAMVLPIRMMFALVMYERFSNLSEIMPPMMELEKPKMVRAAAFRMAY